MQPPSFASSLPRCKTVVGKYAGWVVAGRGNHNGSAEKIVCWAKRSGFLGQRHLNGHAGLKDNFQLIRVYVYLLQKAKRQGVVKIRHREE